MNRYKSKRTPSDLIRKISRALKQLLWFHLFYFFLSRPSWIASVLPIHPRFGEAEALLQQEFLGCFCHLMVEGAGARRGMPTCGILARECHSLGILVIPVMSNDITLEGNRTREKSMDSRYLPIMNYNCAFTSLPSHKSGSLKPILAYIHIC